MGIRFGIVFMQIKQFPLFLQDGGWDFGWKGASISGDTCRRSGAGWLVATCAQRGKENRIKVLAVHLL
jgi:hypothetical protein